MTNVSEMANSVDYRVKDIRGKGENAGKPAFSPLPSMISKVFSFRVIERLCGILKEFCFKFQGLIFLFFCKREENMVGQNLLVTSRYNMLKFLADYKILDFFKFKAVADDKLNVAKMMTLV